MRHILTVGARASLGGSGLDADFRNGEIELAINAAVVVVLVIGSGPAKRAGSPAVPAAGPGLIASLPADTGSDFVEPWSGVERSISGGTHEIGPRWGSVQGDERPRRNGVTQLTVPNPQDLQGQTLFDAGGEGIGVIEGVYLDNATRAPEWAAVRIGPSTLALVPLAEASSAAGGVRVDYPRQQVLNAPFHLTGLDNEVTEDTEDQLYAYYAGGANGSSTGRSSTESTAAQVASTAKDEAAVVASTARDEAADVASTAKDQAAEVASTARDEAAEVATTAKDEAAAVVGLAREEGAQVVSVAADEARELAYTTRSELEAQAETQLAQLAETMHRTAGQALALARGNVDQAGPLGDLVGRAGHELQSVAAGIEERGSQGLLEDAQRVVRQRPRAAIFGTAVAVVAGARLMGTPAGERIKERLAPLREQAIEAGRNVAEELKPMAQQRAERAKAVVTSAADQVKQEAQGSAQDVKVTAKRSARAVKGTTRQSARTVKATAKQSGTAVKQTTKRAARTAAPVG